MHYKDVIKHTFPGGAADSTHAACVGIRSVLCAYNRSVSEHCSHARYTIVKNGPRRLFVPNSAFLTREFMVVDDADSAKSPSKRDLFQVEDPAVAAAVQQPVQQPGYGPFLVTQRPVWAQAPQHAQQHTWYAPAARQ